MSAGAAVRIAVTGASGFCGGEVARLAAARGADVVCLGRRPGPAGRHVAWDAATGRPDLAGADAVVHLAAAVGDPPSSPAAEAAYRAVNVDGAARLLDAAGGRPVVFVSSASVYRPGPYRGPVTELHPADRQRNAYGRTKAAGERLALAAGAVVLRPRAVYGPGDPHLLPRLRSLVRGARVWLPGPDVGLSLTAVGNLAGACLAALGTNPAAASPPAGRWPAGAYNVADEVPYRRDAAISAVLGVPVRRVPRWLAHGLAGRIPTLTRYAVDQLADGMVLDIGRARARGWRPAHTLDDFVRGPGPRAQG